MAFRKVKFIEVKSEIGAGTRGASLGPDAIKIAALDYGSNMFRQIESTEIKNENQLLFESPGSIYAKRIKGLITLYERISAEIQKTVKNNGFPIVLAGDHS
ncbi:MAG TPA: arginase family protein, partial [Bacteroidia bacterium]|nr:arginase family protein [Bacteroidia bacterium]